MTIEEYQAEISSKIKDLNATLLTMHEKGIEVSLESQPSYQQEINYISGEVVIQRHPARVRVEAVALFKSPRADASIFYERK